MISTDLARELRASGLVWRPQSGDRFQLDEPEFEADVYTVSEMTVEARSYPTGDLLAFNGTTEWALDSVALEDALWLPSEAQLREMLRGAFRSLTRLPTSTSSRSRSTASDTGSRTPSPPTRTRTPSCSCCAGPPERHVMTGTGSVSGMGLASRPRRSGKPRTKTMATMVPATANTEAA